MLAFEASSTIAADPLTIWRVLTDGPGWSTWDSAVIHVDGTIGRDRTVTVFPEQNPELRYPVKVVDFVYAERMTWRGGMPLGLFTATRTHVLRPRPDGTVLFRMRESYAGPLAGPIGRSIPDLQPSFERFAAGLKQQAENLLAAIEGEIHV